MFSFNENLAAGKKVYHKSDFSQDILDFVTLLKQKYIIPAFQLPEIKFCEMKLFSLRNWKWWDKPHILLTVTIPFERQKKKMEVGSPIDVI